MAGRPTKYVPDRVARIVRDLRSGNTRRCAAEANGIDQDTFCRWMLSHADFAESVREAEAAAERAHANTLAKAAHTGEWKASVEWLKRRRPDEWGDRVTHAIDADIAELLAQVAGRQEDSA
jgi:hypothetical protein